MALKYYTRKAKRLAKEKELAAPTLPDDIIFEILILLPVEALLRLKTVSKQWLQWIEDPDFIEKHLKRDYSLILSKRDKVPRPAYYGIQIDQFVPLSSCRGLLLQRCVALSKYVIRNPSTRQILDLPDPHKNSLDMSLAYVMTTREYKVVNLYADKDEASREGCEVLTIGDHDDLAWKPLKVPAFMLADSKGRKLRRRPTEHAIHYVRQVTTSTSVNYIQVNSLDLVTDTFSSVIVPTWFATDLLNVSAFEWDQCLGIGTIDIRKRVMSVLLLKDHKQPTWAKTPVVFRLDGLDSADLATASLFTIKDDCLWFYVNERKVILYDPVTQEVVRTEIAHEGKSFAEIIYTNWSLVLLNGMRPDNFSESTE